MSLSKAVENEEFYDTTYRRTGKFIIISNKIFSNKIFDHHHEREGTEVDIRNLETTFGPKDFDFEVYVNLNREKTYDVVRDAADRDYTDYACFIFCILTHGAQDIIYATDFEIPLERIIRRFSRKDCPTLAGKPKIFFIQACQGETPDPGVPLKGSNPDTSSRSPENETNPGTSDSNTSQESPIRKKRLKQLKNRIIAGIQCAGACWSPKAPDEIEAAPRPPPVTSGVILSLNEPHFFVCTSSAPGHASFRHPDTGSWFIESLCEAVKEEPRQDLMSIMESVNEKLVQRESNSKDPKYDQKKQIACINSTLTKKLVFPLEHLQL